MNFTQESQLEDRLIQQLINGVSQWTYRRDLNTEEKLWVNLRQKLEQNNVAVLDGHPLTDQEFSQVKNQLTFVTFYEAAKWLAGENGVAKVQVQREDASLGTIRLNVLKREDIAGGMSSYEVVNQVKEFADDDQVQGRDRRFDVSLLINGLPLIHIELKNRQHPFMDAFRQIQKYGSEGKFNGIFSAVQMFVVTNGTNTRYIAAARGENLEKVFLTTWVDEKNNPVEDYIDFAKQVLSIPQAHKMVTQYTVIDSQRKALILLRPYQIHAIEAVRSASKRQQSGYVWHTTGSGKTLTSYKVARNLLQIPSIDKTIFIVDRIDLDEQTTNLFVAYAENDVIEVNETENVRDLTKKLLSTDRTVIVTTIQKLNYVLRRFANKQDTPRYKKMTGLHLAFVVDECHRAVTAEKQRELQQFFRNSLWYGFTGTPIFKENAKDALGNLPRTTEEQYGPRLHEYTIKEAIHDQAVLGFNVTYNQTISDDQLVDITAKRLGKDPKTVANMSKIVQEEQLSNSDYLDEGHMLTVVDTIINQSRQLLNLFPGSKTYTAILTTSSIAQAQRYYTLFKQFKAEKLAGHHVSQRVKEALPDFPKVAITYSITENEEQSQTEQSEMATAITDYNAMFDRHDSIANIAAYNNDVNLRLARKSDKYNKREEQLDLVIVVDRLLTGFDAPCLSTLFIDRSPMTPQGIIQAFSRTNRIFDDHKKYGQIVIFQKPAMFAEKVKEALILYSNGGENYVLAPEWKVAKKKFREALITLHNIAPDPDHIDVGGMDVPSLRRFAKAYQSFDKTLADLQVYAEYDSADLEKQYHVNDEMVDLYSGQYVNAVEKIRSNASSEEDDETVHALDMDIEYELRTVRTEEINYEYIVNLVQSYVTDYNDQDTETSHQRAEEIDGYITKMLKRNQKLGGLMEQLWKSVQDDPTQYANRDVSQILDDMKNDTAKHVIEDFARQWKVSSEELMFVAQHFDPHKPKQTGEDGLIESMNYEQYKASNPDHVSKLRYWPTVKEAYRKMVEEKIMPLREY
ncbi:type I restriction endonuclease subunit R [Schleiferilactobacillus perolens]|jgi:type I restriction enzyme R subunit|uniref:type I restriction endonuclease subunit R n=1 Tax=Schleiferilactobacillus perolens TaxID=100468 RepID=UPI002353DBE1|nr:type I restriction endonuclease subunit R [Schleiferilactobacillus perolens]MCI2170051.1 type I restriction endonuclease subunit R [Schleiferilactobacillus perolens]